MKSIYVFIIALVFQSCSSSTNKQQKQENWDKQNIRELSDENSMVLKATKTAQDSLPFFVDRFKTYHGVSNYNFFVKAPLNERNTVEHMWFIPYARNENSFLCVLDNVPSDLKNYTYGDTVEIEFGNVEDFAIVKGDTVLVGNYLQREMEREKH